MSTASLPDIVFMLLFFFMTVTTMKDSSIMVKNNLPQASEVKKLEKKELVITIYVGAPEDNYQDQFGTESRIQLNDKFAKIEEVGPYILAERETRPQELQNKITVSLKVDKDANMGLVSDIKQEMRKVNALKINYTTAEGDAMRNIQ